MILGQRTVIYAIDDMQIAKEWYNKLLQKKPYFENENYIGYNVGGYELGLQTKKEIFGENFSKAKRQNIGSVAYWGVADIKSELARAEQIGAKIIHPIANVGGDILIADFLDPFGNLFGLIENPHFQIKN